MNLFDTLFSKKKATFKVKCPITKESIEPGYGYLLTTAEVISSKKYWDTIMTEPETMSYTVSHFKNQSSGTHMRSLIFEKHSSTDRPWIISDSCIHLFENINKIEARNRAKKWWDNQSDFTPDHSAIATDEYKNWKEYAILEAGRNRVIL